MLYSKYGTLFFCLLSLACASPTLTSIDETENQEITTGLGTCVYYGDPDSEGPVALNCIEPTGSAWTTETFKEACENHWDVNGTYESNTDACPQNTMEATCDIENGGNLIGASYEGYDYGGTLYYYDNSRWEDATSHCTRLNGTFAAL